MRNILTLAAILSFSLINAQEYYQKNIEAHQAILGTEEEEFARDGIVSTPVGEITYNTLVINMLHAVFNENTPWYPDGKAFFTTLFGMYSSEEKNALDHSNGFGMEIDTLSGTISDHYGDLLASFTDSSSFRQAMEQIIDTIVFEDIDVLPIGMDEISMPPQNVLTKPLVNNIYPNPSNGNFNIIPVAGLKNVLFSIYNTGGYLMHTGEIKGNGRLNLETLPKGIYYILFREGDKKQMEKIVVK